MESVVQQPSYPKTGQNAVKRHRELAQYDVETVHSIFNTSPVAHVSFVPDPSDPKPVVLPMIARVGQFPGSEEPACYVHGYVSARMFRQQADGEGFPVCIAATKILNLVLSITPFSHNYDYRSAVIHGHAKIIDPDAERDEVLWAMQLITDGLVPGRWDNSRTPPTGDELTSTRILRVRIDTASAKIHDSGIKEQAKDLKDDKARATTWTGTIPYVETLGTPIPAETNLVAQVPAYMKDYISQHNQRAHEAAHEAAESGGIMGLVSSVFGAKH